MEKGPQPPQAVTYTAPIRSGVSGINEDDPRYKCCCGVMHVRTGAMVLAVVEVVLAVLGILGAVSGGGGSYKVGSQRGSFLNGAVTIIVCSLMIYGLRKTRRYFLIPHMVFQILAIIACFIFAVLFLIAAIGAGTLKDNSSQYYDQYRVNDNAGFGASMLGACAVAFALIGALEIWFFLVVLGAFRYLRDKETAGFQGNPMVQYGGGNV